MSRVTGDQVPGWVTEVIGSILGETVEIDVRITGFGNGYWSYHVKSNTEEGVVHGDFRPPYECLTGVRVLKDKGK